MALPITIPNTFANATTSIPLSQLDNNFSTVVVAINGIGNGAEALANVNITGGAIANVNLSTSNVNISGGNVNITTLTATTGNITTINATTVDATNLEVTNVKSKNGANAFVITDTTGNVNFDSNTLVVDASNNRVGIGTSTPNTALHVSGIVYLGANSPEGGELQLANVAGGVGGVLDIDSTNTLRLIANSTNSISFQTNSTARMAIGGDGNLTVDSGTLFVNASANRVGVNWTSPQRPLSVLSDGTEWAIQSRSFLNTADSSRAHVLIQRAKGSQASPTTVVSTTLLGGLSIGGYDGTNWTEGYNGGVELHAYATQTWTSTNRGSEFLFNVTPNNTVSPITLFTGTQDGYLRMAAGTNGIQFGGDTAAANALDDYEEGAWTPSISAASTAPTGTTYDIYRHGRYTKIGRIVHIRATIVMTNKGTGGSGDVAITGLPFAPGDYSGYAYSPLSFFYYPASGGISGITVPALYDTGTNIYLSSVGNAGTLIQWSAIANDEKWSVMGVYMV